MNRDTHDLDFESSPASGVAPGALPPARETVRLTLRRIVYANAESSFRILKLEDGASHREITAVGEIPDFAEGTELELTGRWETHAEFGRQLRIEAFRELLPTTPEGLKRFLASGAVPGVGEALAARIVEHFGAETLEILENQSRRLTEVDKIGPKKAAAIARAWHDSGNRRETFIFLQGLGLTPGRCAKLCDRYGDRTADIVRNHPYQLAEEFDGIGFVKADELAAATGLAPDSPERITAGAAYLANTLGAAGHTGYPRGDFERQLGDLVRQPPEVVAPGLDRAIRRRLLCELDGDIYTPALARAETELPRLLAGLCRAPSAAGAAMGRIAAEGALALNAGQARAVELAGSAPVTIITGGPGVGKTTVVGEIVRRARAGRLEVALAAPTGRAAKRLAEATGMTAKTLHRLLQFEPRTGKFACNRENPLHCDLLVVDEVSMLDLLLAFALFRAVQPGTAVVLVGDRDQLPSVGPGTVLAALLESGEIPSVELTEVFRQAASSWIVRNAHRVNRGLLPACPPDDPRVLNDFYWIRQEDPARVAELIATLTGDRIPRRFGMNPVRDIQVLSPMNRGECGVIALNERLRERLNGGDRPRFRAGEREFRAGDKVMQIANNYDKNVYNGDLGRIGSIRFHEKKFMVVFDDDRSVEYDFDEADQLQLAYAITVHKSQGCEFPVVIVPLLTQHYLMLQRHLLYTAMTRAKKLLILIGGEKAVQLAVENARREPRHSQLTRRLREAFADSKEVLA